DRGRLETGHGELLGSMQGRIQQVFRRLASMHSPTLKVREQSPAACREEGSLTSLGKGAHPAPQLLEQPIECSQFSTSTPCRESASRGRRIAERRLHPLAWPGHGTPKIRSSSLKMACPPRRSSSTGLPSPSRRCTCHSTTQGMSHSSRTSRPS